MSKVGESMIQSAIEALEFAKGENNDCVVHIPEATNKSVPSLVDSETIERGSSKRPLSTLNCHHKQ